MFFSVLSGAPGRPLAPWRTLTPKRTGCPSDHWIGHEVKWDSKASEGADFWQTRSAVDEFAKHMRRHAAELIALSRDEAEPVIREELGRVAILLLAHAERLERDE
jgi:hypothetical protein